MPNFRCIKCPFYITQSRHRASITCEAAYGNEDMEMCLIFKHDGSRSGYDLRETWIDKYCSTKYEKCPYYQDIMKKYESENKENARKKEKFPG